MLPTFPFPVNIINASEVPELLYPLKSISSPSSISISTTMTAAGMCYCGAYKNGTAPSSIFEIVMYQKYVAALHSREVQIVISNLSPSTTYTIYCLSMDFNGNSMSLERALANSIQAGTTCCGSLSVSLDSPRDSLYPVLRLRLSAPPNQTSVVSLSISSHPCEENSSAIVGVSVAEALPSSLTFIEDTLFLMQSFSATGPPGCYSIMAISSGYDSTTANFKIANTSASPYLSRAEFSEDGRYVTAVFSSCTDFGVTRGVGIKPGFSCSEVLILPNANNTSTVCMWLSCRVIQIDQRQDGTLLAGDLIGLQNGVIRSSVSDDGIYSTVNFVSIELSPNPVYPIVALLGPVNVTACQNVILDSTLSSASGGRAWQEVRWAVHLGISRLNLSDFLNSNYRKTNSFVIIPNGLLQADMYQVELTLTNFMGRSSTAKHSFTITKDDITLEAHILRPFSTSMFRNESLHLAALASIETCNASASALMDTAFAYSWSVYDGTLLRPSILSTSLDPSQFWLPADVLNTSSLYVVSVSVKAIINGTIYEVSNIIWLNIKSGGIAAAIDGGSPRSIGLDSALVLNASGSFLRDDPGCFKCLGFSWSCFDMLFSAGPNCGLNLTASGGVLYLPSNTLPENDTLVFTVAVLDFAGQVDFASSEVRTQSYSSPSVSVGYLGAGKVNPGYVISLSGSVITYSSSVATWTCDEGSISKLSQTFSVPGGFPYTIDSSLLFPGQSYTFTLLAAFVGSVQESAFASVLITMNSPPSGYIKQRIIFIVKYSYRDNHRRTI